MKPLPWPSALRSLCLSWVMVCSMFGVAHAQGPAVITDPHQQVEQLMRQDQIEPALAKIQAHLAQRPRDPQMRFWQAVLLTRQGKREQAIQVYTALTQDFPELAEPHNNLGVLQAANNDIDLAQRSFELALRADPQHALAHENLADVLLRQAQQHYQRAAQAPAPIPQRPLTGLNPGASAPISSPRPNLGLAQKQQLLQPLLKLSGPTP